MAGVAMHTRIVQKAPSQSTASTGRQDDYGRKLTIYNSHTTAVLETELERTFNGKNLARFFSFYNTETSLIRLGNFVQVQD